MITPGNIYLDIVEKPVKEWICRFCDIDGVMLGVNDDPDILEQYCLTFPEIIDGKHKIILVYVEVDYPSESQNIDFIDISKTKYLKFVISSISHTIENFYKSCFTITNTVPECVILNNTILVKPTNYDFVPYPKSKEFVEKNIDLYNNIDGVLPINDRTYQNIINDYCDNQLRLMIKIDILDVFLNETNCENIPDVIEKKLLSDFIEY